MPHNVQIYIRRLSSHFSEYNKTNLLNRSETNKKQKENFKKNKLNQPKFGNKEDKNL
jgi:hypothetical protein